MSSILVSGGSGYIGNYILKTSALKHSSVLHYAMSWRGILRKGDDVVSRLENVKAVKGDCLNEESYPEELGECGAVIHTVGTLIEGKNYEQSYDAMNRDSTIKLAQKFNEIAESKQKTLRFIFISSEKAPPFLSRYLTSKLEAEKFLTNECPNLALTIIRPGFVVNKEERSWSVPLAIPVNILYNLNDCIAKTPLGKPLDFLFPAHTTKLETIAEIAMWGAQGDFGDIDYWTNEMLLKYENGEDIV
jgi:nucleoside-diphosphate-sugar epimerase